MNGRKEFMYPTPKVWHQGIHVVVAVTIYPHTYSWFLIHTYIFEGKK